MMAFWFLGVLVLAFVVVVGAQGSGAGRHNSFSEGNGLSHSRNYNFFINESNHTRLCHEKTILTVNGQFPGPTIYARRGDVVVVNVYNQGHTNITLHWHGVNQPRSPWWDGPAYVTQCPIQPGNNFTYKIIFSEEEGTLWWHAHSGMDRATVHGAIIISPRHGTAYPYRKPHKQIPIILVLADAVSAGGDFQPSDANTINGQPGDLLPCSSDDTFTLPIKHGETYMLQIINAALTNGFFLAIAGHRLTVVSSDASYTKPFTTDHIFIDPGQTMTVLLKARRRGHSNARYYMAARPLATNPQAPLDNSTATAVLEYIHAPPVGSPDFPILPAINDSSAAEAFTARLRSLASKDHPTDVPRSVDEHMLITVAVNEITCPPNDPPCKGPHGNRFAASLNNISFETPRRGDILGAYYRSALGGVANKTDLPDNPPLPFNFTADNLPPELVRTAHGTSVKVLAYGTAVEVVLQGTMILGGDSHPMHLHGFSFYVVGRGIGNFDRHQDSTKYNLVDPPYQNTVSIPKNGWVAIRFRAVNPGVWFMHCHFERHMVWGMETVFIVKDGKKRGEKLMPPPPNMPSC
uniref:Uncharacterized protein n=1 Tax=Avena sativa TaxID=4498 RepID=A0ACD5WSW6_AVESA